MEDEDKTWKSFIKQSITIKPEESYALKISVEHTKYRGFHEINRYKEVGRRMPDNFETLPVNSVICLQQ